MGFVKEKFYTEKVRSFIFLMKNLNISQKEAQKIIDKGRLFVNGEPFMDKSGYVFGNVEVMVFKPEPKGLMPIFKTHNFAIFNKPSGLLIHPKNRLTKNSLLDEARGLFGNSTNIVHRLDYETSGIVIASFNLESEVELKLKFEKKEVKKSYLALVKGKIQNDFIINKPILKNREFGDLRLKVLIDERGKNAETEFKVIKYFDKVNMSLLRAFPKTGRQHQIRAHLNFSGFPIVGDTIYGVDRDVSAKYLDGVLSDEERLVKCGALRLMLHSESVEFSLNYLNYKFVSNSGFLNFIENFVSKYYNNI